MQRQYRTLILAATAMALCAGFVFSAAAWPGSGPYLEKRTYLNNGKIVGVEYVSHGCLENQPPSWGEFVGTVISHEFDCFSSAPGPGL